LSKRIVDVVFATLALTVLAPLLILTGALICLLLGRPIIATERTVGLGGKVFALFRFRTESNCTAPLSEWAGAVTSALRSSGIDKLPHLYNVVRGDMSLVGPQLIDAQHAMRYGVEGPELLMARPGLVSVQRYGHILGPPTPDAGLETLYIRRWSLGLDLNILRGALACIHAEDASSPTK
jgi:lipopolysaccharide/colanic/teichoic acid biosynthesis glycosyltransferase